MADTGFAHKVITSEADAEALRAKGEAIPRIVVLDKDDSAEVQALSSEDRLQACCRLWTIRNIFIAYEQEKSGSLPMKEDVVAVLRRDYGKPRNGAVDAFLSASYSAGETQAFPDGTTKVHAKDGSFCGALDVLADPFTPQALFDAFKQAMKTDAAEAAGAVPAGTYLRRKNAIVAQNQRAATKEELRTGKTNGAAGPLGRAARATFAELWKAEAKAKGAKDEDFEAWVPKRRPRT